MTAILNYFTIAFRITWIFLSAFYVVLSTLIWILMLRPLLYIQPWLYWKLNAVICTWSLAVPVDWMWTSGITIKEAGDDISMIHKDESLLIANHNSNLDALVILYALQYHIKAARQVTWTLRSVFKWLPFGILGQLHGDFFLSKGQNLKELTHFVRKIHPETQRKWIALFPEGRFHRVRKKENQCYAEKMGYPAFEHVLHPRMGALKTILEATNEDNCTSTSHHKRIKYIIDVTIGYPEPIDFPQLWLKPKNREIHILYRVYPVTEVPQGEEKMQQWLFERWQEKDRLLEHFFRMGEFQMKGAHGTVLSLQKKVIERENSLWLFGPQLYFLASFCIQCFVIGRLVQHVF